VRQAEVQTRFLKSFASLYPQFRFRGIRHFTPRSRDPFQLALRLALGQPEIELDMLCVILPTGEPGEVRRFLSQIAESDEELLAGGALPVLIAPRIDREAQTLSRAAGVGYFDLAGNAGLQTGQILVEISGERAEPEPRRSIQTPFEGKSERVVRRLLLEPARVWAMRDLAQAADVSLGLASMVTTALTEIGGVAKGRTGLSLMNPGLLLDAWSERYDLRRSPFRTWRSDKDAELLHTELGSLRLQAGEGYALTLWSGAQRLLPFDEPTSHVALYWAGDPYALAERLRLSESVGRTVVFAFQPYDEGVFWEAKRCRDGAIVAHPLQLYLDLASGDEKEMQLARRVRERFLQR
jgi:hypothetical protein